MNLTRGQLVVRGTSLRRYNATSGILDYFVHRKDAMGIPGRPTRVQMAAAQMLRRVRCALV